jgi:hypothetical protein
VLVYHVATYCYPINITLDGQNYREWSFCVETTLRGHGFAFHLLDDPPEPTVNPSNASEIKIWTINDGKVMATIVNSVKPSMIMNLSSFKTAKVVILFTEALCSR